MSILRIINGHMNGGACPTGGSLGECCAISYQRGHSGNRYYVASLYLWPAAATLKPAEVAKWFRDAGCSWVTVHAALDDEDNEVVDGACTMDGTRPWDVHFGAPAELAASWGLTEEDQQNEMDAYRERGQRILTEATEAKVAACLGRDLAHAALRSMVREYEGYFEGAPEPRSLQEARAVLADADIAEAHSDDLAVDRFASAMKAKLAGARAKGRSGRDSPDQCTVASLVADLVQHVWKGDPVDVANFAMFLHHRQADPALIRNALVDFAMRAATAMAELQNLMQANDQRREQEVKPHG